MWSVVEICFKLDEIEKILQGDAKLAGIGSPLAIFFSLQVWIRFLHSITFFAKFTEANLLVNSVFLFILVNSHVICQFCLIFVFLGQMQVWFEIHSSTPPVQISNEYWPLLTGDFHCMQLASSWENKRKLTKYFKQPTTVSHDGDSVFCALVCCCLCYWGINLFYDIILYCIRLWLCNVWGNPTSWEDCQYSFSPNQWKNGVVMV